MDILVEQLVFYSFAAILVVAGFMMILSRNPVRSALFLVLAFVASAVLWMLLEAEFLALILVFVYVGAVMTLFLFVVMMLTLERDKLKGGFVRYLPFAVLVVAGIAGLTVYVIAPNHFGLMSPAHHGADYSNIKELGSVLYTQYAYPFELAAVTLLVAIIAAISLSHLGRSSNKTQIIAEQLDVRKDERLKIVNMSSEGTGAQSEGGDA